MRAHVIDMDGTVMPVTASPLLSLQSVRVAEYGAALKAVEQAPEESDRVEPSHGLPIDGLTLAPRPFDLSLFAYATTVNTYHARAIRAKVKDIAERGWTVRARNAGMTRQLTDILDRAFEDRSLAEGLGCVWQDYEALGQGYLEVRRDSEGRFRGLTHIPAVEMWPTLDGKLYLQRVGVARARFRRYGAQVEGDNYHEVAAFIRWSPWSTRYGVPSILPAWKAVIMHDLIQQDRMRYFTNATVPDWAVLVEGEAGPETIELVKQYFQTHLKGAKKSVLLLETSNAKITFQRLSDEQRDASFQKLITQCRDEVLVAHGVPPQKLGISEAGKLGGDQSSEQERWYANSIVRPGQAKLASLLTRLLRDHDPDAEFVLDEYDIDERELNARVDGEYLDRQVITPEYVQAKRFPDIYEEVQR